jgi:hypothetical protein
MDYEEAIVAPTFTRILVDADSLLYRCGFAAEGEPVSHACHSLKLQLKALRERLNCDNIELFISGVGNFRDELSVSTVYKGTRPGNKPSMYEEMREYLIKVHGAKPCDGMEADDAASIELFANRDRDSGVVLAAMDKDLWNTPGWHFNYDPRKLTLEYVTQQEADKAFILQLLEGDTSDNIPGLPAAAEATIERYNLPRQGRSGCGKATARKLLSGLTGMDALNRAWEAYSDYGKQAGWSDEDTRAYFLEQGRLLWMTRGLNHDGSPVLWEVPASCDYWKY